MPNEEPEGPQLPPKKTAKIQLSEEIYGRETINEKYIEVKGVIGAFTAALILISYLVYYYYYYNDGVKLNELYFVSTGLGIFVLTGLLFTFFKNVYIRTILLFTSIFYLMLEIIYIVSWLILGQPYAYLKESLIVGLIIGIIYFIYDKSYNKPRNVNK